MAREGWYLGVYGWTSRWLGRVAEQRSGAGIPSAELGDEMKGPSLLNALRRLGLPLP